MSNPFEEIKQWLTKLEHLLVEIKNNPQHQQHRKEFGSITLAEEVTGLSQSTIYKLCCKGKIPHFKKCGRLYFKEKELIDWLQDGKQKLK